MVQITRLQFSVLTVVASMYPLLSHLRLLFSFHLSLFFFFLNLPFLGIFRPQIEVISVNCGNSRKSYLSGMPGTVCDGLASGRCSISMIGEKMPSELPGEG